MTRIWLTVECFGFSEVKIAAVGYMLLNVGFNVRFY